MTIVSHYEIYPPMMNFIEENKCIHANGKLAHGFQVIYNFFSSVYFD